MINDYEENIIEPPVEFWDKPVPKPRTIKSKPVPAPRTKITPIKQASKGAVKWYQVGIKFNKDPLAQLNDTALFIENYLKKFLKEQKGIKIYQRLVLTFIGTKDNKPEI